MAVPYSSADLRRWLEVEDDESDGASEEDDGYEPCCDAPKFDYSLPPSGCTSYPDGSMGEDWRCLTCGQIPTRRDGGVQSEFSDSDEGS